MNPYYSHQRIVRQWSIWFLPYLWECLTRRTDSPLSWIPGRFSGEGRRQKGVVVRKAFIVGLLLSFMTVSEALAQPDYRSISISCTKNQTIGEALSSHTAERGLRIV